MRVSGALVPNQGELGDFALNARKGVAAPCPLARGLSSKHVLLVTVVSLMTIVWGLCLTGAWFMRGALEASIGETQLATVQQLANEIDRKLRERLDSLAGEAAHFDVNRINDAAYARDFLAARYSLQQNFPAGTALIGLGGYAIAGYPAVPERRNVCVGDRDYLREVIATQQPLISKPAMGRITKRPMLFMSVPVLDHGGEVKAVLVGYTDVTDPGFLGQLGVTGHVGAAQAYLMSLKDKLFIVSPDSSRVLAPLPAPGTSVISDRLQAGFEGTMVGVSRDGTEKLLSAQKIPTAGWLLELAKPTAVIFKPVQRIQTIILLSGLAVTLLALLVMRYTWSHFFGQLRAATFKLDDMTRGNEVQRRLPEAGGSEIRSLSASFNRLLACIETQEELFASVVDSTNHLIWSVGAASYELLTFNAGLRDYMARELGVGLRKGMSPEDILPAQAAGYWRDHYHRALRDGPYTFEHRGQFSDSILRVHFHLLYLDGRVFGISVFAEDITELSRKNEDLARHRDQLETTVKSRTAELERALAESATLLDSLRKSEALYRAIGETIDYGVWICQPDGRNTYASQNFLKMLGITQEQCSGFGWSDRLHPDDAAATLVALRECMHSGSRWTREHRLRGADGLWHHVLARGVPVRDEQGKTTCWAGIHLDISEIKKTEEELRVAKEIAERANEAKSRFLAAASHDLRQPLSALGIYTHILSEKLPASEQNVVARMKECVGGLSRLLNDLLDLSKLSAGVVTARPDDFPIAGLLDYQRAMHNPVAEAKGLRLRCVRSRLIGRTDPVLLQRIVSNFIDNALRYTSRGGAVVGCRRRQGRVFIEVWDSGIGIAADKQMEIFEEFRQLGDAAHNSGSGLGLAIAAKAAALLGLEIQVRSQPGRGSVFAVELPTGQSLTPQASPERIVVRRSLRIALVEDNRLVREAIETAMQESGHRLVSAAGGDELLAALGPVAPDVLVSDYRLPEGRTGFEVIAALRAEFGRDIPAIIITGDTDPALLRKMAEHGIIVLHKPLDLDELQACLEHVVGPLAAADR